MTVRVGARRTTGWRATIAVAMSNYIEAGSIIAIATSLSFWQEHFGLDDLAVGLLASLSANAFGAAAGAAIGGPLCDRYGRKFIYTYDLLLFMFGSLLAVFASSFAMLLVAFVLTGIAVGAGVTASWTYIAEEAPADRRAAHVGTAQLAWSLGPMVGYLLAAALVPLGLLGSRLIFAHLFVVAAITWWVRRGLAESTIWTNRTTSGKQVTFLSSLRGLLTTRVNVTALLFLFGVYALWNAVAGQAGIFQPRVYDAAGFTEVTQQYLLQVVVWGCTSLTTYLGFMLLADRVSRRWLYFSGAALGIVAWAALIYAPPGTATLLFFAIGWGVSSGIGAQAFYGLWTSELFATRYRASAQGVLFLSARIVVGLLSVWFPMMLTGIGLKGVGVIILGLLAVALLVGTIGAPNTQGRTLQDIERERYGPSSDDDLAVRS
ncbi:inositol transporter-like SP family MFS transporter [Prauserella isguenensis]|uniref:Inositol transporter-like SP family MFS transporter n=1 Tax=Prauserella isguenensis TaxID=1470180 RepID=A0A839S1I6_9PSEU|nr:MFS transporter [Prauserella isguenensis]MBB3051616.1 inositol transporter-like SP family MFS transporter [Prauserella isguenensis]